MKGTTYFFHMSALNYIQVERPTDDIAVITINRPEVLNAINVDVIAELSSTIDVVAADDSIKVVIITGKGERSFCAYEMWKSSVYENNRLAEQVIKLNILDRH
jgi:1,4-dihydroxy-2-naphthoyl-CoA synthase